MEFLNPLAEANFPAKSVSYTGTAGSTDTWPPGAEGVMVWSDQACYVLVGENVLATIASTPIPAFTPIPFKVPFSVSGQWRVSAVQVSAGGTVYAKPINAQ